MAKTAKKAAKKAGVASKKTTKENSKRSAVATQKPIAASTSKTGVPSPKMSGEQIEKELALAHKVLSQAAFQINYMLSTRRVSPKRIAEATEKSAEAAAYMQRLQKVIQSFAQAK